MLKYSVHANKPGERVFRFSLRAAFHVQASSFPYCAGKASLVSLTRTPKLVLCGNRFFIKKERAPLPPYDRHLQARYSTKAERAQDDAPVTGTQSSRIYVRISDS